MQKGNVGELLAVVASGSVVVMLILIMVFCCDGTAFFAIVVASQHYNLHFSFERRSDREKCFFACGR